MYCIINSIILFIDFLLAVAITVISNSFPSQKNCIIIVYSVYCVYNVYCIV